jgi:hypothetical protein
VDQAILRPGVLVRHPGKPEWGLGKVLEAGPTKIKVYFKDNAKADFTTISLSHVTLEVMEDTPDPVLDNLPPFLGDRFDVKAPRVAIQDVEERFRQIFPLGFNDPKYLGKGEHGERDYKWVAHEKYAEALGGGQGEELLAAGKIDELSERTHDVVSKKLNLLSPYEVMAFRDGLAADPSVTQRFFSALLEFIAAGIPREELFAPLAEALLALPVEEGKARVATWPVLTILPFLAAPDCFMFLKPVPTKEAAERRRFNLQYSSDLRWITYQKLMEMSEDLLEQLRPLGARDYIDVQSFIWVIAKY